MFSRLILQLAFLDFPQKNWCSLKLGFLPDFLFWVLLANHLDFEAPHFSTSLALLLSYMEQPGADAYIVLSLVAN